MGKITRNAEACYGCRTCELICSYHHNKVFSPELSSIKVARNNKTGAIEWRLEQTCNSCANEALPLCVEYCTYGALTEDK